MMIHTQDVLFAFMAAAISVVLVHETIALILKKVGMLPTATPWSTEPTGPFKIPKILNSVFWGGLWGIVYVYVKDALPFSQVWLKGIVFGILIALFSNFIFLPLLKRQPLFMGSNFKTMSAVLIILSAFGLATAVIFEFFRT